MENSFTEKNSKYDNLEKMSVANLLANINNEDKTVPFAIEKSLKQIEILVKKIVRTLKKGGRVFYIGAGTSGRLCVVDASECPPTFGTPKDMVIAIIAGGDGAIRTAVEGAEDDKKQGFRDLQACHIGKKDIVIGVAASGTTPYTVNALRACKKAKIATACIVSNSGTPLAEYADYPIEVIVGPEFITGSTRMKAGTAQKLVLNMITTATMIRIGRVEGNKMTHMKMSNEKLIERGVRMVMDSTRLTRKESADLLQRHHNDISKAIEAGRKTG